VEIINKIWYNFNHVIIMFILVIIGIMFNHGIETLLIVSGFWFGREHSQAEYKYMKLNKINRSNLGFFDGFKKEAWDKDSLMNDLLIPIFIGILTIVLHSIYFENITLLNILN